MPRHTRCRDVLKAQKNDAEEGAVYGAMSAAAGNIGGIGNFFFDDINALAKQVLDYHKRNDCRGNERILDARLKIAEFAESYANKTNHMSNGSSGKISNMVNALKDSDTENTIILVSAHQPNLFAYSGILKKLVLLKALEKKMHDNAPDKKIVCMFFIADHDFVHNKWVRSAEIPSPLRKDSILRLNVKIDEKDMMLPTNKIAKPSPETLDSWRAQIVNWISENSALALKYAKRYDVGNASIKDIAQGNFEEFWGHVKDSHRTANNLAEFSSFLLTAIANNVWRAPVVFANFSDCFTAFGEEYEWLVSNTDDYLDSVKKSEANLKTLGIDSGLAEDTDELSPIWMKCPCNSKYRISYSKQGFAGKCIRCGREINYTSEELKALSTESPNLFEPRSISMPLVLARAMDMSCYIGGIGGLGYLIHSKTIGERLNSPFPPSPFWNVDDQYAGIETLASAWEIQRIAELHKLNGSCLPLDEVIPAAHATSLEFNRKMENGIIPKNAVSERERQLLEKIPHSLGTKPCMIDYAINIGLHSAYEQWLNFLINDGRLHSPVELSSIIKTGGNAAKA